MLWTCWLIVVSLLPVVLTSETFKLTILHTNDVHARIDEFDAVGSRCTPDLAQDKKCYGGIARHQYIVEKIRSQNPNTIFLNAGDYYQGTMWFYHFKGNIIGQTLGLLRHDAITLGNHEFDDGSAGLLPLLMSAEATKTPVLGCNVDFRNNSLLKQYQPQPSIVVERGGVKIGIIGFLTPDTMFLSKVDGGTILTDEIECIRSEAEKLKKEGVNIIIATGHSGYIKDQEIAMNVPAVGVVVGGHSHSYLSSIDQHTGDKLKGPYPTVVNRGKNNNALVVQDYWLGKYMGYINVTFDKETGVVKEWEGDAPLLLDFTVPKDPEVEKFIATKREDLNNQTNQPLGTVLYELSGDKETCRFSECALGNMLADACTQHIVENLKLADRWNPVDICVVNGGGIRGSLPKGNLIFGDLITVSPFANNIWILNLTGEHVLKMYETGFHRYDIEKRWSYGGFLHSSGARIVADVTEEPFKRVKSVEVLCSSCNEPKWQALDPKQYYRVAMTSYLAQGGDNHNFKDVPASQIEKLDYTDTGLQQVYFRKFSPLHPITDDRLKIITKKEQGGTSSFSPIQGSFGVIIVSFMVLLRSYV